MDALLWLRQVRFDQHNQSKLEALTKQNMPVKLSNCDIQYNLYSKRLEVAVRGYTKIDASLTSSKLTTLAVSVQNPSPSLNLQIQKTIQKSTLELKSSKSNNNRELVGDCANKRSPLDMQQTMTHLSSGKML